MICFCIETYSQDSAVKNKIQISGYCEVYFSKDDNNNWQNESKQNHIYNHKNNNNLGINLAFVKASLNTTKYRGNIAIMYGDYAKNNLSNEPKFYQNVFEANVGLKLLKQKNIWLDIGIMPSHIGFESAIGADCYTLTRSLLAENSPYFETGLKLSFTNKKENLITSFLYLNGWQNVKRKFGFKEPSFGFQVNYKPNQNLQINYSNFLGYVIIDSFYNYRHYHNFYAIYQASKSVSVIAGLDVGIENTRIWLSPVIMAKKTFNQKSTIATRFEHYNDEYEKAIQTKKGNGFIVNSLSINYDFKLKQNLLLRSEVKGSLATENIYDRNKNSNFQFTTSAIIKL